MVYAAGRVYAPIVALLIDAGVDVNRRYGHGLTALMWAAGHDASAGVEDVDATLKLLIDHGATLDLRTIAARPPPTLRARLCMSARRRCWKASRRLDVRPSEPGQIVRNSRELLRRDGPDQVGHTCLRGSRSSS